MMTNGGIKEKGAITATVTMNNGGLFDVDDFITSDNTTKVQTKSNKSKLDQAIETNKLTMEEMSNLVKGVDNKIAEIGLIVEDAQTYKGVERVYNGLGKLGFSWAKERALRYRHDRIDKMDFTQIVNEISKYAISTIRQLGETENLYKTDQILYNDKISSVLNKQAIATPKYLEIKAAREKVENEVSTLEEEIKSGTLSQAERPSKESILDKKKRELDQLFLDEKTYLSIVKEAQEALPTLTKNRDASSQSVQSIHAMRQAILEKSSNLDVVLSRAATAMKAAARAQLYKTVDPTFNKGIELVTKNNIATAGALLETYAERMKHAAIDPAKAQEFLNELLGHISDAAKDLKEIEEDVENNPYQKGE